MSEHVDTIPELDPDVAALVAAYSAETARTPAQIDAVLQQVTTKLAAPAAGTSVGLTPFAAKLVLVGVVVGAGAWLTVRASSSDSPAPQVSGASVPADTEDPSASVVVPPVVVSPVVDPPRRDDVESIASVPAVPHRAAPKRMAERSAASVEDEPRVSLAAELRLLKEARRALRDGDGARALERVRTHRKEHPTSALAEERDATEVMALCSLGRADEAGARAAEYETRYRRSQQPLLARCGGASTEGAHE
jgi:hypothetical protein